MNYKKLITKVKQPMGKEYEICVNIVDAYEKYYAEVINRPFKKEVDEAMVDWVSLATHYDKQSVREVLEVFITLD